jgi:hypothetical protein
MTAPMKDMYTEKRAAQRSRVYVLVNVAERQGRAAASVLRRQPGVVVADVVEAQPSVIMIVEARDRQRLAELTVQALTSVEEVTADFHLMPAGKP